jgi:hypothetical protein
MSKKVGKFIYWVEELWFQCLQLGISEDYIRKSNLCKQKQGRHTMQEAEKFIEEANIFDVIGRTGKCRTIATIRENTDLRLSSNNPYWSDRVVTSVIEELTIYLQNTRQGSEDEKP